MPNNPRQHWKRELERASGNLDGFMSHLVPMEAEYRPHHPEIADALQNLLEGALIIQEAVNAIESSI